MSAINGRIGLRILVDRASIEIFGNGGEAYMASGALLDPGERSVAIGVMGGEAQVARLDVYPLKSTWKS